MCLEGDLRYADTNPSADTNPTVVELQAQVEAVRIAQCHYPERLALAVVANPPRLFWVLWKAIQPILDPVTRCTLRPVSPQPAQAPRPSFEGRLERAWCGLHSSHLPAVMHGALEAGACLCTLLSPEPVAGWCCQYAQQFAKIVACAVTGEVRCPVAPASGQKRGPWSA